LELYSPENSLRSLENALLALEPELERL
jgi:hypothetical protein